MLHLPKEDSSDPFSQFCLEGSRYLIVKRFRSSNKIEIQMLLPEYFLRVNLPCSVLGGKYSKE